jgi:hypothetical protein
MSITSPDEIRMIVAEVDLNDLRQELIRFGVPFVLGEVADGGILGFDFAGVVSLAVNAGTFGALAAAISAYLKHRKRTLHIRGGKGGFSLSAENIGEEELSNHLNKIGASAEIWFVQERPQRSAQKDIKTNTASKVRKTTPKPKRTKKSKPGKK